ncbi:MAG: cytochrome c oxidase assembly protein [Rhodocyclaceae bacterium]|nr:cytochrome c oxidase assembly protein [Rhodocyclaceae bacterium]MBX3671061.1 cytochrome c oxidase assembly protein [Rhodocyclaceae bacterium]
MTVLAQNSRTLQRLALMAVVMFGFGFALVPFYYRICEALGVNNLVGRADASVRNTQVDYSRSVSVEFDTNTRDLPWTFRALSNVRSIHPGELVQVDFEVRNQRGEAVTGQAIPSFSPARAAQYFHKLECFCFERQTLKAGERRVMPVVFVLDRSIPSELGTVTLSYTFFDVPAADAAAGGRRS